MEFYKTNISVTKMYLYQSWIPQIIDSTKTMFYKWEDENKGVDEFEIEVSKDLHDLTSDIISKVAFGSNYEEGKEIFDLLEHYHLVSLANRSVYHMTKTRTLKWVSSACLVGPTDEIDMARISCHGPMLLMTATPQYGMQIIFRRL